MKYVPIDRGCLTLLAALAWLMPADAQTGRTPPRTDATPLTPTEDPTSPNPEIGGPAWQRLDPNIKNFLVHEQGRKPNEVIEQSEIAEMLDQFERENKTLIADRDVLESSTLTTKELAEALDRRRQTPAGRSAVRSLDTGIEGGKSLAELKPFQRRDVLNRPDALLGKSKFGLTDGEGDFHQSGSQRSSQREGAAPSRQKDIVARAILHTRPNLIDAGKNPALARALASGEPVSDSSYAQLVKQFLNKLTEEEWQALDLAIQREQIAERTEAYSNGRSRFDARGNEVYPNGQRKYDDRGRQRYPNGSPMFDAAGNALHSNGRPKFSAGGVALYANGQAKQNAAGASVYPDGSPKQSNRGATLYDNGQPTEKLTNGIPVDPQGRSQHRERDGVQLFDGKTPRLNERGEELNRSGTRIVNSRGEPLYENGQRAQNSRGLPLSADGGTISAKSGFQGRVDGAFPILGIDSARIVRVDRATITVLLETSREEMLLPIEGAFLGVGTDVADPGLWTKLTVGSRVKVVIKRSAKYVDGQLVGIGLDPVLLAIFTNSDSAREEEPTGEKEVLRLHKGKIEKSSAESIVLRSKPGAEAEIIAMASPIVQKSTGGRIFPVLPAALTSNRSVTLLLRERVKFEKGRVTRASDPVAIGVWQDGP
jgi:hypothetical protein